MITIPQLGEQLTDDQIQFLQAFRKSCSHTIISMLKQSQSGHPGGSLSALDFLVLVYSFIISQTGEKIIVSNGHISPAVYSVLAEMKYIPKQEVIDTFRQVGSIFEGHITRHVAGVHYGTGPLGIGASVATGMAQAAKLAGSDETIYGVVGDGECQEGIVYEMMHNANKYQLNNLVMFMDYNAVQLSGSLEEVMPVDFPAIFKSAHWNVIDIDGHDYQSMWTALREASQEKNAPTLIIGRTIMGKGVEFMEGEGREHRATWHGNAPKPDDCDEILKGLVLSDEQRSLIDEFMSSQIKWTPEEPYASEKNFQALDIGTPTIVESDVVTDCRSAYGNALKDLADKNPSIIGMTADLGGSVKTDIMKKSHPDRVIEVGIAEQHMVSCAGGLSLSGFVPFCSTFGAFTTSRAKDMARVNDINKANVKMVSTHCGLSVGEDGPTHQAIDDMGSFHGFFHTTILEPSDPNQCDHMIRYAAKTYGNFYVRMGRAKLPVITKEDGTPFYDASYQFTPGCDLIREGFDITVLAAGPMVEKVLAVRAELEGQVSIEVISMNSLSHLNDQMVVDSLKKTGKGITIEDHNIKTGYGHTVAALLGDQEIAIKMKHMGVTEYQLSGKAQDLYKKAGLGSENIKNMVQEMTK
ncbi:MAG: transketolase [Candidatus Gracilibacteria bacterium]|nr:transketolase [Candidatus Gracilibacteria bacterium]